MLDKGQMVLGKEEHVSEGRTGVARAASSAEHGVHPVDEVLPPGRLAVFKLQHVLALLHLPVGDADRAEQQLGYREAKPDPTRVATA